MNSRKKIKVLRIINRFNIGGPTYNATFLTNFLSDDFETLLIGGLPEENEANSLHILEKYGVEPVLLPEMKREPNLKSDRIALKKIKTIIREFKPDIVHTHASKAGALGRRAAVSCNVPIIVHTFHGHIFHSYFGKIKTALFKNIERYLARKSTGIIAISEIQKKELCEIHKIASKRKTTVIPLGFDLDIFQKNSQFRYEILENLGKGSYGNVIKVEDCKYNKIICIAILEHVYDPFSAVANLKRMLKNDGVIYGYVPYLYHYHAHKNLKFQDYFRFSKDALIYLFKDFDNLELYPYRGRYSHAFNIMFPGRWKNHVEKTGINIFLDKFASDEKNTKQCSGYYFIAKK